MEEMAVRSGQMATPEEPSELDLLPLGLSLSVSLSMSFSRSSFLCLYLLFSPSRCLIFSCLSFSLRARRHLRVSKKGLAEAHFVSACMYSVRIPCSVKGRRDGEEEEGRN